MTPLRGYQYERMSSPFKSFILVLYDSRQEARSSGDEAMAYVFKIIMNSLYGRFGMNPESTVTVVCSESKEI